MGKDAERGQRQETRWKYKVEVQISKKQRDRRGDRKTDTTQPEGSRKKQDSGGDTEVVMGKTQTERQRQKINGLSQTDAEQN